MCWGLRGTLLAAAVTGAVSAAGAAMLFRSTGSNNEGLELGRVSLLDVQGVNALAIVLGCLFVFVAILCGVNILRSRERGRQIVLGPQAVIAPATLLSAKLVTIPYSGMKLTVEGRSPRQIDVRGMGRP